MLGIPDPWVLAAYLGSILSALLCVVYGIIYWNKEGEEEEKQIEEELDWLKKEKKMEEKEFGGL
jgi:hypothetical protein